MRRLPIKNSFAAGEISKRMWGRVDTEGYRNGYLYGLNMLTRSHGPAESRKGFQFTAAHVADTGNLYAYQYNENLYFNMVFLDGAIYIHSPGGPLPSTNHVKNPFFVLGGQDWTFYTNGDYSFVGFFESNVRLICGTTNGAYATVEQEITIPAPGAGGADFELRVVTELQGRPGYKKEGYDLMVGTAQGQADLLFVSSTDEIYNVAVHVPQGQTSVWLRIVNVTLGTEIDLSEVVFNPLGVGTENFASPYSAVESHAIHVAPAPDGRTVFFMHQNHPVYELFWNGSVFDFKATTFINSPPEWAPGNYPWTGCFYQGRLWLGGALNQGSTFWASKSIDWRDFTIGTNADDALEFQIAAPGRIEWMMGFTSLVIGTVYGEYIVSSDAGVVTPGDIDVKQQSSYGSRHIQPAQVGDQIFYVSADGRKVRSINYEWEKDKWLSKDLMFVSEHLTEKARIEEMEWVQNPDDLLWCKLSDGDFIAMSYDRGNNIYGWHKHTTYGRLVAMSSGRRLGKDELNIIARRQSKNIFIEKYGTEEYKDSQVAHSSEMPISVITGLTHLEGMLVQLLVDGSIYPDQYVTGGTLTIDPPGHYVSLGLAYEKRINLLPIDSMLGQVEANSGLIKRWNKVFLRLVDSGVPIVNDQSPPERSQVTPLNLSEPPSDRDVVIYPMGADIYSVLSIYMVEPLPLRIVGVFGEADQEDIS